MSIAARWSIALGALALSLTASGAVAQAPTVTVGGLGYAQYYYQFKADSSLTPAGHQNNFDVTRAYINVIGKFGHGITTRVTTDIDGRKAAANQLSFRLKYAYVAWTPEKSPLTFKLGQIHTPLLDWEEALWDYRMQGPMALERGGYVSSSDFGAGVDGNWMFDGVNMQLGVYNGENYNGAPGDSRKDVSGRVSVRVLKSDLGGRVGGLRVTAYGQYGLPTTGGRRQRYLGLVSYKSKAVTLGAEYAITKDSTTGNGAGGTVAAARYVQGKVFSAYGVLNVPKSAVALIGRVDVIDPDKDSTSTATNSAANVPVNRQTRIIAGVSYQISPNLRVLADVDLNSLQHGGNNKFDATRQTAYFQTQFTF